MKYLKELRTMLITALVVFLAMQILVAVIQPYIVYILISPVLLPVVWMVYDRARNL